MVQCIYWAIILVLGCGEFASRDNAQIKYIEKLQRTLLVSGAGEPQISDLKSHDTQDFFSDRLNVKVFYYAIFLAIDSHK